MDLMGMMGKLKETQQKIEDTKKRLDTVLIDEQSNDSLLKVTLNANRKIKSISIDDALLEDKEQLEDRCRCKNGNADDSGNGSIV